jgi:TatD DNase family protein
MSERRDQVNAERASFEKVTVGALSAELSPLDERAPRSRGARLIDIGVNLTSPRFDADRADVLARASEAGLEALIITGVDVESSARALELCLEQRADPARLHEPTLYSTAGVHPHDSGALKPHDLTTLRSLHEAHPSLIVAVGECGLDYDRDYSPRASQRACFEAQLELAAALKRPLFLHERAAHEDFYATLKEAGAELCERAVVHCFTGSRRSLSRYLELGCSIGVTGWLCDERRGGELRELAPLIPLNRLLVETDAPYLTPRSLKPKPKKGRNEPATLPHIVATLATLRGEPLERVWRESTQNAARLFQLPLSPR